MIRDRSLLERIDDPRPNAPRTVREDPDQLARSVLNHLRKMLNTRHGSTPILSDYGIPDLTELVHSFPDSIAQMQQAIRTTLERYEPRLRILRITYLDSEDDVLILRFGITAQLLTAQEGAPVWFQTMISSSGQIKVGD